MQDLLKVIPKAIVHLRQQYQSDRLGLVFGAGISKDLAFPNWDELVKNIAYHPQVNGKSIYESSSQWSNSPSITQFLFQHFKTFRFKELENEFPSIAYREKRIMSDWRTVVHDVLYEESLNNRQDKIEQHPYLKRFIPLINKSEFTINYNFDDTLEVMLSRQEWNSYQSDGRPYQAVWNPYMQFRDKTAVIYHPNGFLPGDKNLQQSDELIFSEESFSDQLIDSMSGKLSTLLHQFTKKTCLFVGLSLDDHTLKHLLRQSAAISPGNFHYFIRYTNSAEYLTNSEKEAIYNSNFEVYNLITLFLNSDEISSLAQLVNTPPDEFKSIANIAGVNVKFTYYLVGTVAAGKSTALSHFGSLKVYEEWLEDRPKELSRPFKDLSDTEKKEVDKWVDNQFYKKNLQLINSNEGIHILDRSPLDPITFSPDEASMKDRAKDILHAISPGQSNYKIDMGQVFLIRSTPKELKTRLLSKQKITWTEDDIEILQNRSINLYKNFKLKEVDNTDRSMSEIVKEIAKLIHTEDYKPIDLHQKLLKEANCE